MTWKVLKLTTTHWQKRLLVIENQLEKVKWLVAELVELKLWLVLLPKKLHENGTELKLWVMLKMVFGVLEIILVMVILLWEDIQ